MHVDHELRDGLGRRGRGRGPGRASARARRWWPSGCDVGAGPNLEARARAARHAVLPEGTLLGHTADDQAETMLLNLLRGAGLDGLAAMAPDDRRPILALRRSETVALCAALGLEPVHDPSNDDPSIRRNRVRHEVLPLLADVAGRDVVPVLARQAGLLRDAVDLLGAPGRRARRHRCGRRWPRPRRRWPGSRCARGCAAARPRATRPTARRSSGCWRWPGSSSGPPTWERVAGRPHRRAALRLPGRPDGRSRSAAGSVGSGPHGPPRVELHRRPSRSRPGDRVA